MNTGHQMDLAEFSTLVLSLSSMQRQSSVENVQDQILKQIQAFIPFSSAWWGVGAAGAALLASATMLTVGRARPAGAAQPA